jgi:hypothetical protein
MPAEIPAKNPVLDMSRGTAGEGKKAAEKSIRVILSFSAVSVYCF